jgi:putative RNA 2'-phosphotransferase
MSDTGTSKFLSLVLRHKPSLIGVRLDQAGWVEVPVLLDAMRRHGRAISAVDLERIVRTDAKGRYALEDGRIRANQGHSVRVDLGLEPAEPPAQLFHGTPVRNVEAILREGLRRGQRQHVHLSADPRTAAAVGARRGSSAVLAVDAEAMHRDGHVFFRSANGVWLVDHVPPHYLSVQVDSWRPVSPD